MDSSINLSLTVSSSSTKQHIAIKVVLDGEIIKKVDLSQCPQKIQHQIPDIDGDHVLEIVMSGKTMDDTTVDAYGNIQEDVLIDITDVEFDGINIDKLMWSHSVYSHDFNGTRAAESSAFFGTMGCNGRVTLAFSTPVYLWLLENM